MAVSSRTMKVRETTTTANRKRAAREVARQEAEIADLKRQLAEALERIGELEQQLAAARKKLLHLVQTAVERHRQAEKAAR